jgi:hypothetical protein
MQKPIEMPDWKSSELDVASNWDKYIGLIWANIFIKCDLPLDGVVVEIAPGTASKVGRGLEAIGFRGTLYVIEPEKLCLDIITKKYRKKIGCTVIPLQETLESAIPKLPKVDAIVANHPLDDMILGNSLNSKDFVDYFGEKFGTSIEKTKFLWGKLEENQKLLEKLKKEIVQQFANLIGKTSPGFLAISQYKSYYFQKNGVLAPDNNALDVLVRIRKKFAKFDDKKITENIDAFNADITHWIVLRNPKIELK